MSKWWPVCEHCHHLQLCLCWWLDWEELHRWCRWMSSAELGHMSEWRNVHQHWWELQLFLWTLVYRCTLWRGHTLQVQLLWPYTSTSTYKYNTTANKQDCWHYINSRLCWHIPASHHSNCLCNRHRLLQVRERFAHLCYCFAALTAYIVACITPFQILSQTKGADTCQLLTTKSQSSIWNTRSTELDSQQERCRLVCILWPSIMITCFLCK